MNTNSQTDATDTGKARLIGAGFVGAFALSVLTVIYTGLMVEGSRSEFDVGFRSVTLAVGETLAIDLRFDVPVAESMATLEVELPPLLDATEATGATRVVRNVMLVPGSNEFTLEVSAVESGSDYLIARLIAAEPVGLYRVFVTVTGD